MWVIDARPTPSAAKVTDAAISPTTPHLPGAFAIALGDVWNKEMGIAETILGVWSEC